MAALTHTEFNFPGQKSVYHGKVRDVYNLGDRLVMVATDRISAFDVILPEGIPYKGQVLNQIAAQFLDATTDICPNWKMATPDPMVTVGLMCEGFAVEMISPPPPRLSMANTTKTFRRKKSWLKALPLPKSMPCSKSTPSPSSNAAPKLLPSAA